MIIFLALPFFMAAAVSASSKLQGRALQTDPPCIVAENFCSTNPAELLRCCDELFCMKDPATRTFSCRTKDDSKAIVRATRRIHYIQEDMCFSTMRYHDDAVSYDDAAHNEAKKVGVYETHFEHLIGRTENAMTIANEWMSVECSKAEEAKCERENAKATNEGEILFRKPSGDAFKYAQATEDDIPEMAEEGFEAVFDCFTCKAPSNTMIEVGRVALPPQPSDVHPVRVRLHVAGDLAFLGDSVPKEVYIYDVSDKTSPLLLSRHVASTARRRHLHDIWYDDGWVYTAHRFSGLTMINVTDPTKPITTSTINHGYIHKGLITHDDYLFSGKGFNMFHLDKVNGKLVTSGYPLLADPPISGDGFEVVVTRDGNYAYRPNESLEANAPLLIYNVADKTTRPKYIGKFHENQNMTRPPWEMEISPDGLYLFVLTVSEGFHIYDLTFPASPQLMSYTAHPNIREISFDGDHSILYVRNFAHSGPDASISAYDVSNPRLPVLMDCYFFAEFRRPHLDRRNSRIEAQTGDLWYSDGYVYAVQEYDLVILKVT